MKKKILITGFEPFGGDSINPSEELIKFLQKKEFKNEIKTLILPVTFDSAFQYLKTAFENDQFDYVIMTGLAKERNHVELEKIGINWIDAKIADNDGYVIRARKINNLLPDGLFSSLDLDLLLNKTNNELFKISFSAGTFVCNYLYFRCLAELTSRAIFIHLPKTKELDQEVFNSFFNFIELNF